MQRSCLQPVRHGASDALGGLMEIMLLPVGEGWAGWVESGFELLLCRIALEQGHFRSCPHVPREFMRPDNTVRAWRNFHLLL